MAQLTEATMHATLRRWLEQQGHSVYSEVSIGPGDIDLYTESPSGETWGVEAKNHWSLIEWGDVSDEQIAAADATDISEGKLREVIEKQLIPYADAEAVDKLFLATQNPEPLIEEFDRERRVPLTNSMADPLGLNEQQDIPDGIGFIKTPPCPTAFNPRSLPTESRPFCDYGIQAEISRMADSRTVTSPPSISEDASLEAQYAYTLWSEMVTETDVLLREAPIPNPGGERANRVDLTYFYGDYRPWEIYKRDDPESYGICGIEIKTDFSNPAEIREQLREYIESGGLTRLYLAFPESRVEDAKPIWEDLQKDVGLIAIGPPNMRYYRHLEPAPSFSLKYDGMRWKEATHKVASVGWGKTLLQKPELMNSVFGQT